MNHAVRLYFQATGTLFEPANTGLAFVASYRPGTPATFGGRRGKVLNQGGALYQVPEGLASEPGRSDYEIAFAHLGAILPVLRAAGATDFILHLRKISPAGRFAEELTRSELRGLHELDCQLFIYANADAENAFHV